MHSNDGDDLLVEAMVKLHGHVVHAGTDFEKRALAHFEVDPPSDIYGYRDALTTLAARRAVSPREVLL